jgi:cation transport ATPase
MSVFPPEAGTPHSPADSGSSLASQPEPAPGTGRRHFVLQHARQFARAYPRPFAMLGLLLVSLALDAYQDSVGDPLALVVVVIGASPLVRHTIVAMRHHRFALDYLGLLAIAAALAAIEFQVGAVIALMLATG